MLVLTWSQLESKQSWQHTLLVGTWCTSLHSRTDATQKAMRQQVGGTLLETFHSRQYATHTDTNL